MYNTSFDYKKQQENGSDTFTRAHMEKATIHACHVISLNSCEEKESNVC